MEINFDKDADAMYIQFQPGDGKVKETIKLRDGIMVDIGKNGKLFGIEILDVSHRVPVKELGHVDVHMPVYA